MLWQLLHTALCNCFATILKFSYKKGPPNKEYNQSCCVCISMAAKGKHYTWEGTWSSEEILSLIQNDKVQVWMSRLFWILKNSLKTDEAHFDCLNRQSKWVRLGLAPPQIHTHTGTQKKKTALCCRAHFQHVLNGGVVLTWRNSFRAREVGTITPPSITALRGGRQSPIRELERCGADRWIDSPEAERQGGDGDDREDRGGERERETAGHCSD